MVSQTPTGRQLDPTNYRPEIYGTVQPAIYTDPECRTCRGTGVSGPYGLANFGPLAEETRGAMPVVGWWEPCGPCGIRRYFPQPAHLPGTGMRVVVVELDRPGPSYGPGEHTHIRTIAVYLHNGTRWMSAADAPSAIKRANWTGRPAVEVVGDVYPGAEYGDAVPEETPAAYAVELSERCTAQH